MDLMQHVFLLSETAQDFLCMVYRQSKITGSVQINFISAKTNLSPQTAAQTARSLQEAGLLQYESYGRISLTAAGKQYAGTVLQLERKRIP